MRIGWRRRRAVIVGVVVVVALAFGPVALAPAQSEGLSLLSPDARNRISGVVTAGAPRQVAPGPLFTGPFVGGADIVVSGVNTSPQNEPEITTENVVSGLPHAAGANDYGTGTGDARCGAYFSTNAGATWSRIAAAGGAIPIPPALVALGASAAGDPDLAYSTTVSTGSLSGFPVLYYSCLAFSRITLANGIYVARSFDGGASYSALDSGIVASSPDVDPFNDKPFNAVDTISRSPFLGNVYVCWTEFSGIGSVIKFRRSTTQATSWGPVVSISASTSTQGCDMAIGSLGEVYIAYLADASSNCTGNIRVRRSDNGGVSFGAEVLVAAVAGPASCSLPSRAGLAAYRINSFPRIATDRRQHVVIVFNSNLTYGGVASDGLDIWSTRAGRTAAAWSVPVRVNNSRHQLDQHFPVVKAADNSPGLTATGHGTWHVCFHDRSWQPDPPGGDMVNDWDTACTHNHSDALAPWDPVQRVSDASSFDGQFGGAFIGDYIGMAIRQLGAMAVGHVHAVFPRASAGEQDIFAETYTPSAPPETHPRQ